MYTEIDNAIAIIGMACKFPQSETHEAYWRNIREGKECLETLSQEQLEQAGMDQELLQNKNYVNRCSYISDIDKFDADFFKINPKEATFMDPQQRLLMEKAWEAIEDAGYPVDAIDGKVAVFASTSASSYFLQSMLHCPNFVEEAGGIQGVLHGLDKDHIATKIAYKLNLTGPAITVQSACSSSMVGLIMACQNLLTYQCDMALAGGVTINVPEKAGYLYEKGGVTSPDGYCRPFDENANGTVFGSGVGCVVLKRLEDAVADHDRVYAVIRGFAVGNDGNDKVGYTAPGTRGQMDVISDALEFAEIDPESMDYVEAHGTGTVMGDPIEVDALTKVYRQYTQKTQYCALGSVKANVGHLNSASGIAGVIKTALVLHHRGIPPMANFRQESSKIDFQCSPFYINTAYKPYEGHGPMRAAVSSFGIGGTNGHVVMEEFCAQQVPSVEKKQYLIPVSARSEEDLRRACENLSRYLSAHSELYMADVERTLQCGRKAFDARVAFVVGNANELRQSIGTFLSVAQPLQQRTEKCNVCISPALHCEQEDLERLRQEYPMFQRQYKAVKALLKAHGQQASSLVSQVAMVAAWIELGLDVEVTLAGIEDELANPIAQFLRCPVSTQAVSGQDGMYAIGYHTFLRTVADRWEMGKNIRWEGWISPERQKIVTLPTYPFKRNSYWSYQASAKTKRGKPENVQLMEKVRHIRPDLDTPYVAPEDEMQQRLVSIWGDLLGIDGIGVEDDFFELGGHSLMATQLIAAIQKEFLVELEISQLFDCGTISSLAELIAGKLATLIDAMDEEELDAYLQSLSDQTAS